ncbi:alpha/beta hydrolase [Clostridiaceae bacterium 14S0207]|nr:alpha/beta hydrolase [Clostridiaceae bacterium 14S0207]
MKINFRYEKTQTSYNSGFIKKGKFYRCNYIKFKSPYKFSNPGTETIELYNFEPKTPAKGSALIIHGLGTKNIRFLFWLGPTLASFNVSCNILILPGHYTRVAKGCVSGKNYVYPDIKTMYNAWEHAIVDIQSSIDFLEETNRWKEKNCILGYCLGGMLSSIASCIDPRIDETILLNTGGYFPKIIHECSVGKFARRMFENGYTTDYFLQDKYKLYGTYDKQLPTVRKFCLNELLNSEEIHPLFKIDPLSYGHLLNKDKVTFIDGIYDETLPITSRSLLFKELEGSDRYLLPMTHGSILLFQFFIAQYVMLKLKIGVLPKPENLMPQNIKIPIINDLIKYIK